MALSKFSPDRQPRRDDPQGHMTVWQVLLLFIDWVNKAVLTNIIAGTATVAQTATTALVVHGFGAVGYRVSLTPSSNPGGWWWVSNKTNTQFQINLSVAAPVGGVSFDWILRGD